jgi:hypothetical protein
VGSGVCRAGRTGSWSLPSLTDKTTWRRRLLVQSHWEGDQNVGQRTKADPNIWPAPPMPEMEECRTEEPRGAEARSCLKAQS